MSMRIEIDRLRAQNRALIEASIAAGYNLRMVRRRLGEMPLDIKRLESFVDASIAWFDRIGGPNPVPSSVYQVLLDCASALTAYKEGQEHNVGTHLGGHDLADLLERLAKAARPKPKDAK